MGTTLFATSVLTSGGAQLIRDAISASKKIVFTRAKSGSEFEENRGGLAYKDASFYNISNGSISAVAKNGSISVLASFSAVSQSVAPVKSVCLCAQIAKEGDSPTYSESDDIIFAACSDDNSGFIAGNDYSVQFDLPVNALSLFDAVGEFPSSSGLHFVSFTAGESPADGVLQVKLDNGKILDIAANEHSEG